jgi:hypothetical protein
MIDGHIQFMFDEQIEVKIVLSIESWFESQEMSKRSYFQSAYADSTGTGFERVLTTVGGANLEFWSDTEGFKYYEADFPDGRNELFILFLRELVSLGMGIDGYLREGYESFCSFSAEINSEELVQYQNRENYSWSERKRVL